MIAIESRLALTGEVANVLSCTAEKRRQCARASSAPPSACSAEPERYSHPTGPALSRQQSPDTITASARSAALRRHADRGASAGRP